MIWYDMIWYDMIWYDMIWYDMTGYNIIYAREHEGTERDTEGVGCDMS